MVAGLITRQQTSPDLDRLLRPDTLPDGTNPEERVIVCGLSWQRYLDFDRTLGDDRSSPRLYYLDGELEIMTTSHEHERIKKWIGGFLEDYLLHTGIETTPRGQATLRHALENAGAEPDESWCLASEKEFPDLVLEIALTSGGVSKLEVYRRFQVQEVWLWRTNGLEVYLLNPDTSAYDRVPRSRLLPQLDLGLLERCVRMSSWSAARRAFRDALASAP